MGFIFDETERVIEARKREIQRLRRCAGRVARRSALQALAILRRVEHLQSLNDQRRGCAKKWVPPHQVTIEPAESVFF